MGGGYNWGGGVGAWLVSELYAHCMALSKKYRKHKSSHRDCELTRHIYIYKPHAYCCTDCTFLFVQNRGAHCTTDICYSLFILIRIILDPCDGFKRPPHIEKPSTRRKSFGKIGYLNGRSRGGGGSGVHLTTRTDLSRGWGVGLFTLPTPPGHLGEDRVVEEVRRCRQVDPQEHTQPDIDLAGRDGKALSKMGDQSKIMWSRIFF